MKYVADMNCCVKVRERNCTRPVNPKGSLHIPLCGAAVHGHYPDVECGHLSMGRVDAEPSPGRFGKQPCLAARLELVVSGSWDVLACCNP